MHLYLQKREQWEGLQGGATEEGAVGGATQVQSGLDCEVVQYCFKYVCGVYVVHLAEQDGE